MAQKNADYFSRLAAKRNTDENTQEEDDKEETASLENETHLQLIWEKSCDQCFNTERPSNRVRRI